MYQIFAIFRHNFETGLVLDSVCEDLQSAIKCEEYTNTRTNDFVLVSFIGQSIDDCWNELDVFQNKP